MIKVELNKLGSFIMLFLGFLCMSAYIYYLIDTGCINFRSQSDICIATKEPQFWFFIGIHGLLAFVSLAAAIGIAISHFKK